jgi:hypothetical protein
MTSFSQIYDVVSETGYDQIYRMFICPKYIESKRRKMFPD